MGKKVKEIFQEIEKGAPSEADKVTEKASIDAAFENPGPRKYIGVLDQSAPYSSNDYQTGLVYGSDWQTHYAQRQGKLAEATNAAGRIVGNFVPGIIGSIGAIADVPDWFAGVNDQNEEIGNALTRWSNEYKRTLNEEILPIYQQDTSPGVHLGSSEWWYDKGASVVESAAEFAALGFGLGSLITKGLSASKWLTAVDAATGGVKLNSLGQAVGVGTNAFALNQAESILDATQVYDDELKKNLASGMDEHSAKVNAAQSAAHVVNIDRINIALNLSSVGAIMRGSRGTRAIKSMMPASKRVLLEGGQEYGEETVNFFAQNRGLELGESKRKGTKYTGPTFEKLITDMTSAQGVEAGFLGMLGGVAQTGAVEAIQNIRGTNKSEKEWIVGQQNILKQFDDLRATGKLSNAYQTAAALEAHTQLVNTKKVLEAEIAEDMKAGKEPSTEKILKIRDIDNQILTAQAFHNFQRGTTDYLEKAYRDIAVLTDQQAKDNGFTEDELNPKSPAYYKTKANKTVARIQQLEKVYLKAEQYMNPAELFKSKSREFAIQDQLEIVQATLAEKAIDASKAIENYRKTLGIGINNVFTLDEISKPVEDVQVNAIYEKANQLPAVQEYNKVAKVAEGLEEQIEKEQGFYAERSSEKVQSELRAAKQQEVKLKAEIEEAVKSSQAKVEQAKVTREQKFKETKDQLLEDNQQSAMISDDVNAMVEKTIEGEELSPVEVELLATSPAHRLQYEDIMRRIADNQQAEQNQKVDKIAGDPIVITETEVAQIQGEQKKLSETQLETELLGTPDDKVKGKLWTVHNVMAWLARLYTKHFNPKSLTGSFADIDDKLNEAMVNPDILDNRRLDVGDDVTMEVDPAGLMPVVEAGELVWKPWDGNKTNQDNVPIIIKKDGVPIAHLHLPQWITAETTQAVVEDDRKALRAFRAKIIESEKPHKSKVTARTYGKLFIAADKKPVPVSKALKDKTLKFGVWYIETAFTDGRTEQSSINKELIVNSKMMRNGRAYVLVPIMHANKAAGRTETQYWAVPMMPQKLSADMIESAALAVKIHYKVIEGTPLTAEEEKIVKDLKQSAPVIDQIIRSFDITSPEGLKNYLSLFMYAEHNKNTHQKGQSLDDFLRTAGISTDYNAMDIGTRQEADGSLTGVGVFFGSGQVGTVYRDKDNLALDNYINFFKEFLGKVYTHANLTYFSTNVQVPLIKPDGTVTVLNQGGTYLDYLKQHAWQTNLVPHDISKDPAKPNYVYTVQQIIEYETDQVVPSPKAVMPKKKTGIEVTTEQKARKAEADMISVLQNLTNSERIKNEPELQEFITNKLKLPVDSSLKDIKEAAEKYASGLTKQVISEEGVTKPADTATQMVIKSMITPQFADPDAEVGESFDLPAEGEISTITGEEAKTIKDRYRVPGVSLRSQMSLINWIMGNINQVFADSFKKDPSSTKAFDFAGVMEVSRQYLQNLADSKQSGSKFAAKILENWSSVERLTVYAAKTIYGYRTTEIDHVAVADKEEQHALNTWSINTLEQDPTSSLSKRFRRFLGLVKDPSRDSIITGQLENMNPIAMYQYLSSILADTYPSFEEMMTVLQDHLNALGDNAALSPLPAFIKAIQSADQQTKDEFVVAMSKHYVNMHHLYIVPRYGGESQWFLGYDTYIRNDNATAKTAVLKETWQNNLKMDRDSGIIQIANDQEGSLHFNSAKAGQIAEEFKPAKDFDLSKWLAQVGIKIDPVTANALKESGMKIRGVTLKYADLFTADSSPFKKLAKSLEALQSSKDPVRVENSQFMKESFWGQIARLDAKYSDVSHSHTHQSGDKYVFSYANNKYLTDRFRDLKDIKVLTGLADRSFSKHSWWLKQLLKTEVVNGVEVYSRDPNGDVILNTASNLSKNFGLTYMSLQAMKEKGVATSGRQSLEELSVVEHERAKFMYFQNSGTRDTTGVRTGEFFLMTLSNKNTMFTVQSTVPTITFNEDGSLSGQVVNSMFENIVMPEIQRMWDYKENHNIQGYTEGSKLFYLFPKLNSLPIFNEDGSLRRDVTAGDYRKQIENVIRETINDEVKYKIDQWRRYGIIKGKPGNMTLKDFDRSYVSYVRSKLSGKVDNAAIANYAATEMAVSYMLVNTSMFQTIHGDPATYWKSKTSYSKDTQVKETFENITKRLGGEISPGTDLVQPARGSTYNLAVIQDVYVKSKALSALQAINSKLGLDNKDYAHINSTDAVEFITIPEKINFMRQSAKLDPAQNKMADEILDLYDSYMQAVSEGKDPSKYDFNIDHLNFVMQVDKPVMVGTRIDASGVETKVYVKSAAFTLIPQVIRGTELAKLANLMQESGVDRLAFASAMKLGAPRNIKKVFDEEGNFIDGSKLSLGQVNTEDDIFKIDRRWLRTQQEVPSKESTQISRVSQASKLLFVDILHKSGFKLPGDDGTYTAEELKDKYHALYEELYRSSKDSLLKELDINPNQLTNWSPDPQKLGKLIQEELVARGYPPHDLDALGIITDGKEARFIMPPWALAKSGKLEAFLNAIVDNRIVDQSFNGYSYVTASEVGFKFGKSATKKVFTSVQEAIKDSKKHGYQSVADALAATTTGITFTNKFKGELLPAALNHGFHQVVVPWKYKNLNLDQYKNADGTLDTTRFDPELLKAFGMRIPNQGPNSTAAIEIAGFLPPAAGDMIIAPADFVVQMGSDFDIDKLYVYLANHRSTAEGKITKIREREFGNRQFVQNSILDIHLSINTNMDHDIQEAIVAPLESQELRDIATNIDNQERTRDTGVSVNNLAYISGTYQAQKYINSTVASTATGAFAVQNTFNALAQYVPLEFRKSPLPDGTVRYSKIRFGNQVFNGKSDFNTVQTLDKKSRKSHVISSLLSAAVDDEKEQILAKIGINSQNISMANLLAQAGFNLKTISYFLKQDAIQEYCRQLTITEGNEDAALNAVMAQDRFHLDEETDAVYLNRGEDVTKITAEALKSGDYDPTDNKFWSLYNSGVATLETQFKEGDKARDYKYVQYALLLKFRDLNRNEVKSMRRIQSLINTDTKGPGKNMFESIEREKALWGTLQSKLYGAHAMFGEFVEIYDTTDPSKSLTQEEISVFAGQGYVQTGNYMFKPKTIPGFAMAYGVITNNRLWNKYFPYSDSSVTAAFDEIAANMGKEAQEFTQKADRNRRIFRQIKQYINTDKSVLAFPPNEIRRKLLYDTKENLSLASIWQALKEHPEVRNHKFLSNMVVSQRGEKEPKSLLFKKPQDGEWVNLDTYSQVIDSLKKPKELGVFNGINYTTKTFIEHLFLATKMAGTSGLQQELLQFMPPQYSVLIGEAAGLRNFDWNKLSQGRDFNTISVFTKQYFQHNPNLAPQLTSSISSVGKVIQQVQIEQEPVEGFSSMETIEPVTEVIKFQLNEDAQHKIKRSKTSAGLPNFIATRSNAASGYTLFMLTDLENRIYTRISTLGMVNNHEYNSGNQIQQSLIPSNNPAGQRVSTAVINKSIIAPTAPQAGEIKTPEQQLTHENRIAKYGLPGISDSRLSQNGLKQMLVNISKISTREDFRAAADFLSTVVGNFDIKFTTGPTFYSYDVTKPSRGAAGWEDGKLYVKINANLLNTDESLEWTILHELSHAVTIDALKNPRNDRQRAAVRRLTDLYERYKQLKPAKPEDLNKWDELLYPTKNIQEFVVAALTQPVFRSYLNTMKYDSTHTFWDKMIEVFHKIMKSFGLEENSTAAKAIDDIMRLTEVAAIPIVTAQVTIPTISDPVADSYLDEETGEVIDLHPANVTQLAELQKLLNKVSKDKQDLAFDLPTEGEVDPRPEQKGNRFSKLISELRSHKQQLEKRIVEIRLSMPKATVKQKADLERRKENVERAIVKINTQIQEAQAVVKLEDLVVTKGPADTELDEVNILLAQGNLLSFEDIDIINRKVKLWTEYADNFLTESEKSVPGLHDIFKDVLIRANKYKAQLEAIKRAKVLALGERMTGQKLDPKTFYEAITDINTAAAYTLSLDNADHAMLQSVVAYMKEAESYAQEEILEETEILKDLITAVKGKEHITGKNLENFMTDAGDLIMPYTSAFLKSKYSHFTAAKDFSSKGDTVNATKEWQAFRKFVKENEIVFDIRKLAKIDGQETHHSKDAGQLEKQLRSLVGDAEYERKLARSIDKYNNYLAKLQNYTESINTDANIPDSAKAEMIQDWVTEHNPFQYSDYINDVEGAYSNKGYSYVETTPKAVNTKGEVTGWYDERYKALQSDPDVAKLHDHIVNLLVRLRRYLPESTAREFGINSLPALQKSLVESLKTEGMSYALSSMWDKAKQSLTSGDVTQELYGGLHANRYLSVQIDTIANKIDKLYNQKLGDYMRQNMLTSEDIEYIDPILLAKFKEEATTEVKQDTSLDLKSLLGIYTAAVIDYRHKARIEDAVRLVEDVFNTHVKEYRTNAAGKPVTINEEGKRSQDLDPNGLKNLRGMLKYTLDRFFRVPKDIEGKTDKKLYSKKEKKRKAALEEELKKYNQDLAKADTQLAELRNTAEGMPSAEYAQKEQTATESKSAAENRIAIVNQELEKLGRVVTGTGITDNFLQFTMIKGLGWNPFSGLNNMGFGWISNMTEAAAGVYFNEAQIMEGYKLAMNSVAKFWSGNTYQNQIASKIRTLMDNLHVLRKPSEELFQTSAMVSGVASSLHWANIQNRTEYLNQAPVMIAMMLGFKLNRKDGSESNLWEAYGKDGKWDADAFGSLETAFPARERAKFHTRLSEAIRKVHGNYDPNSPIQIKGSIMGRMLSVFRTWAFEGFATRFEKPSPNYISKIQRKGRYRSYGGGSMALVGAGLGSLILTPGLGTAIGAAVGTGVGKLWGNAQRFKEGHEDTSMFEELVLETKYLIRKLSMGLAFKNVTLEEKFTTVDAANLRRNMTELSILMYLMGFAMILKAMIKGEDDDELKYVLTYQLNWMNRLTQDIGFYADPISFQKILRDPIPATSTVEDSFKWIQAANRYLQDDDIILTGPYAGQSRLNRATGRLVPGWKQFVTTQDLMHDVK